MASQSFIQSRERGKIAQRTLADYLRSTGVGVQEVEDGWFPDFDLLLSTGKTIEVKYDQRASDTGNLCLEIEALSHSLADVLAIGYGTPIQAFYLLPLDKARQFAINWPNKIQGGEFGGDLALVKRSLFCELLKPEIIELRIS